MLEALKKKVYEANIELVNRGMVIYTWGNASEIDRESNLIVIKPSGVEYSKMTPEDMVVVDVKSGKVVEGKWRPSSDTDTHLEIYRNFQEIGGVVHTHSVNAVAFAQAGINIPALGTTHADYFYGDIPCTRELTEEEVNSAYERNTGKVIVDTINKIGYEPIAIPGILVKSHGPFSWGKDSISAVFNSVVMEKIAEMAIKTLLLNRDSAIQQYILDKHYQRKHGPNAYYGQNRSR